MSEKPSASAYASHVQRMGAYSYNGSMQVPGPLSGMSSLKGALSSPMGGEHPASTSRQSQNNPMMVLPSGQTVPVSAFLPRGHSNNPQLGYAPVNDIYGSYSTQLTPVVPNYNIPYGFNAAIDMDPARQANWTVNDENAGFVPLHGSGEFLPGYTFPGSEQNYIAGPIQPMKTKDNKGYEMVNLDELVMQPPPIPRAVPALWTNQEDLSLAKCLQNPEGITNIYIRGFMPDTTDEDLHRWASRFGEIESCKAIVEQDTGKCKGFGFVMYYSPASAENCIRGFFHLGFQASYAQKSRNARLKDLEDKASTNIYCTGVPIDWNEADLCKHFLPYRAISTKICRDTPSGVSKEVGFARFETRDTAERVIKNYHGVLNETNGVKLFLRFADTKAQKQLKQQSQERRTWRSREYSYSVEHTPSPVQTRFHNVVEGVSPSSFHSSAGASHDYTPDTSVSPPEAQTATKPNTIPVATRTTTWPMQGNLQTITNTAAARLHSPVSSQPVVKAESTPLKDARQTKTPSPKKAAPVAGKENISATTPQSTE